jgi:hypothetical protein
MVYQLYGLSLTKNQVKSLGDGLTVKLAHKNLSGSHPVYLTTTQLNKINKALSTGKGVTLKMSMAQLKHAHRHGGSIFSTLKNWGNKFVSAIKPVMSYVNNTFVRPNASRLKDAGMQMARDVIVPRLQSRLNGLVNQGVDRAGQYVDQGLRSVGAGVKKKSKNVKHPVNGSGFFDDVLSGVGSVANTIAPIAIPIVTSLLTKKLTGQGAKKKVKSGKGVLDGDVLALLKNKSDWGGADDFSRYMERGFNSGKGINKSKSKSKSGKGLLSMFGLGLKKRKVNKGGSFMLPGSRP